MRDVQVGAKNAAEGDLDRDLVGGRRGRLAVAERERSAAAVVDGGHTRATGGADQPVAPVIFSGRQT